MKASTAAGILLAGLALLAAGAAAAAARQSRGRGPALPPLPDNPYHRFYTKTRRLEELIPPPPVKNTGIR